MPSTKVPTSIQIGSGQLPDNVGSASSIMALPAAGGSQPVDLDSIVLLATEDLYLTRLGSRIIVVVDNTAGPVTVNLPETPEVGDVVIVVQSTTIIADTNQIQVSALIGQLNGLPGGSETINGHFGSTTYINLSTEEGGDWTAVSDGAVVQTTSGSPTPSGAREQYIVVDPSGAPRTVTLPGGFPGDRFTVINPTTSTNLITISGYIDEMASAQMREPKSARTFIAVGSGEYVTLSKSGPSVVETSANITLIASRETFVLVNSTAASRVVTLPENAWIGDMVTIIDAAGAARTNAITVTASTGSDNIMGVAAITWRINDNFGSMTLVRASSTVWVVVSQTAEIVEITAGLTLVNTTSRDIHVLVHTADAAWTTSTRSIIFPPSGQTRIGTRITISDVDGSAATNPIIIGNNGPPPTSGVRGVSSAVGATAYTISTNYGSVSLVSRGGNTYSIADEVAGLVDNFSSWSRVDSRSDLPLARLSATPMFNWSHRKIALHAEFHGLITNFLPVEGFTTGGSMVLSSVASPTGTVGVMRCTVTAGTAGFIHWGNLPTDDLFNPAQLSGFRAVLTPVTANPGSDYDVLVGFGDDISETGGSENQKLGSNGLYLITGSTTFWRGVRQSGGVGNFTDSTTAVIAGNRYVLEYYVSGTTWDVYVNGTRTAGGSTTIPTASLNFGLQILNGSGVSNYVVDLDSLTVFTLDLGNTRHNP